MRRLVAERRGGVGLIAAGLMPILVGFTALAVDVGSATLESRRLQGIADAAAIAAAGDPANAQSVAEAAVAASGWPRAVTVVATSGHYDRTASRTSRFASKGTGSDAVQVALESASPTFFARIFGQQSIRIARTATAARQRMAAFSVGSRLAALNGGLLNAYLSALTGSSVSLSVMDYNSLVGADVDVFSFLDALRTTAHLDAATYNDVVAASVTRGQALDAMADAMASANPVEAAVLHKLSGQAGSGELKLAGLVDPGPLGSASGGANAIARINAMAAVTAILQLSSGTRQVSLDLGASVPGIAATRVTLAIGERPANSPWLTVTDTGTPVLRTAQARLYIESQLAPAALPGIGSLVAIKLPLFVELASAEARLSSIDCSSSTTRSVTIEARPSPGQAAIAALDPAQLGNFQSPVTLTPARLVAAPLLEVDGKAVIDLGAAEPWQTLRFDAGDIDTGTIQTVSSGSITQGIAVSLAQRLSITARILGLPLPVTPIVQTVAGRLNVVAPALDTLIDSATGSLGVHFGQADVRVTGVRCGMAALVG